MKNKSRHIRVGIDCRDLLIAKTGSKTYLSELLKAAGNLDEDDVRFIQLKPLFKPVQSRTILGKIFKHIQFVCWKQMVLPFLTKIYRCDILICTDYFLPSLKFHRPSLLFARRWALLFCQQILIYIKWCFFHFCRVQQVKIFVTLMEKNMKNEKQYLNLHFLRTKMFCFARRLSSNNVDVRHQLFEECFLMDQFDQCDTNLTEGFLLLD